MSNETFELKGGVDREASLEVDDTDVAVKWPARQVNASQSDSCDLQVPVCAPSEPPSVLPA
jgi:hypothetical protein